ncbi:hypothetical protein ACLOJK_037485 [Asimina triloba]
MHQAGVQIPFDFGISELLHVFWCGSDSSFAQLLENHSIGAVVLRVKKMQGRPPLLGFVIVKEGDVGFCYLCKEAEHKDREQPPQFGSKIEVLGYQGLPLPRVPVASPRGGPEERLIGEASGSSLGARPLTGGSSAPVPHHSDHTAREEKRLKERKRLIEVGLLGQGPTTLEKEQEHLVRQEEEDLQAGLALSHEEARRSGLLVASPEALMDPTPLGPALSFVPVVDVGANTTSSIPTFEREAFEVSG